MCLCCLGVVLNCHGHVSHTIECFRSSEHDVINTRFIAQCLLQSAIFGPPPPRKADCTTESGSAPSFSCLPYLFEEI